MPPARRSATKTTAARASSARKAVRARAASTRAATRREVEQSIARFEKQLDGANDALKTLGTHLGRGAQGSYKEVTTALAALRREASEDQQAGAQGLRQAARGGDAQARGGEVELPREGEHGEDEHGQEECRVGEGELELDEQARHREPHDRQALDRVPRKDHALEEDQLTQL